MPRSAADVYSRLADLPAEQWPLVTDATISDEGIGVRLAMDVSQQHFWFNGHFPDHPVLPGIVQLNWAGEISRRLFAPDLIFSNLQGIKFQHTIEPQAKIYLQIDYCPKRTRAAFEFVGQDEMFSSGRVHFRVDE